MSQFYQSPKTTYMKPAEFAPRPAALRLNVTPWAVAFVACIGLAGGVAARSVASPATNSNVPAIRQAPEPHKTEEQSQMERKFEMLSRSVEHLSRQLAESAQTTTTADGLRRQLVALSETTEKLKLELVDVSTHAHQVDDSISNIDMNASTPEILANKLELQKKGLLAQSQQ